MLLVDIHGDDLRRAQGVGHEDPGVVAPGDDVDLLAAELRDHGLDPGATLTDRGTDRIQAFLT